MVMEHVVTVARAISSPLRLSMYRALGERGRSLTDIAREFGLSLAGAHHHLDVLRRAQMIRRRYVGRKAIYFWTRNRWALVRDGLAERAAATERSSSGD
jgi:DNA-binding transcriptional ArsR family regulator